MDGRACDLGAKHTVEGLCIAVCCCFVSLLCMEVVYSCHRHAIIRASHHEVNTQLLLLKTIRNLPGPEKSSSEEPNFTPLPWGREALILPRFGMIQECFLCLFHTIDACRACASASIIPRLFWYLPLHLATDVGNAKDRGLVSRDCLCRVGGISDRGQWGVSN